MDHLTAGITNLLGRMDHLTAGITNLSGTDLTAGITNLLGRMDHLWGFPGYSQREYHPAFLGRILIYRYRYLIKLTKLQQNFLKKRKKQRNTPTVPDPLREVIQKNSSISV